MTMTAGARAGRFAFGRAGGAFRANAPAPLPIGARPR
jgi:hypothetical protein